MRVKEREESSTTPSFGRKAGKDGANADQEKGDAEEAPGRIATVFEGTTERGAGRAVRRLGLVWV